MVFLKMKKNDIFDNNVKMTTIYYHDILNHFNGLLFSVNVEECLNKRFV